MLRERLSGEHYFVQREHEYRTKFIDPVSVILRRGSIYPASIRICAAGGTEH